MWRLRTLAFTGNTIVHYFETRTRNVYLYDVLKKRQLHCQIDYEIPFLSKTITVDKQSIYLIGGADSK